MVTIKQMQNILDYYKQYIGLADYKITLKIETLYGGFKAKAIPNYYENTLEVTVDKEISKKDFGELKSILVHELVHARLGIMFQKETAQLQSLRNELEEELVNDVTRMVLNTK